MSRSFTFVRPLRADRLQAAIDAASDRLERATQRPGADAPECVRLVDYVERALGAAEGSLRDRGYAGSLGDAFRALKRARRALAQHAALTGRATR